MRFFDHPSRDGAVQAAARLLAESAARALAERGRFLLCLSGGKTPVALLELLAAPPWREALPWRQTHVFWSDERCVPFDHPDSNCGVARRHLLSRVPLPEENIHPAPVDTTPPEAAARRWEDELRAFFAGPPVFDFSLLGMGTDGHTASLFPGHPALEEKTRWTAAVAHPSAKPPVPRLTLTLPVLNAARRTLFLCGSEKGALVERMRNDPAGAARLWPAARVEGEVFYYSYP